MIDTFYYKSPVGLLEAGVENGALVALRVVKNAVDGDDVQKIRKAGENVGIASCVQENGKMGEKGGGCVDGKTIENRACADDVFLQLDEYFTSKRRKFDIKIALSGTPFQKSVLKALLDVPYGKTASYFAIACAIKNKNATRAVGNACNKNPIAIIIPCHRIIRANGTLGGFEYGSDTKQKLLEIEGVKI